MHVEHVGRLWICRCKYEERYTPREAGFRWDPKARHWFTDDGAIAAKLMSPAEAAAARAEEERKYQLQRASVAESIAEETDFHVPVPDGLVMRNYQRVGVEWSYKRPYTLNADDPGLGKTIQFVGVVNALCLQENVTKVLVLCPNSLRLNWLRELQKWLTRPYKIAVWNSEVCRPAYVDISILHYDAVHKWAKVLRAVDWDIVCADECHMLKNPATRRARAVLGIDVRTAKKEEYHRIRKLECLLPGARVPKDLESPIEVLAPLRGRRAVFMTGTPLPNRPKELFPLLHYLNPIVYRSRTEFEREFCGAYFNNFGTDANGGTNLAELQVRLRSTVMIRRCKQDVLKELPPKQRSVIEIPHNARAQVAAELEAYKARESKLVAMSQAVAAAKAKASEDPEAYAAAVGALKAGTVAAFSEIAKQRKDLCVAKIPYVVDHLRNLVDGGEKLIVFCHHHEMVLAITKEFGRRFVTLYGPNSTTARQAAVDRFQQDPEVWGIVGTYGPMGTGWTLTASNHVVAAELDWVPGNMTQAEDRAHRIGQVNTVLVEHLVLEGSLDAYMAAIVVEKQAVQSEALDMEVPVGMARTPEPVADVAQQAPAAPRSYPAVPPRPVAPVRAEESRPPQGLDHYHQMNLLDPESW